MRLLHAIYPVLALACCAQVHAQSVVIDFDSLIKGAKDSLTSAKTIADNALADVLVFTGSVGSELADAESKAAALWADAQRTVGGVQEWYIRALDVVNAVVPLPGTGASPGSKDAHPALMAHFARELKGVHEHLQKTLAIGEPISSEEEEEGGGDPAGNRKNKNKKKNKNKDSAGGKKQSNDNDSGHKEGGNRRKKKLNADVTLILNAVEGAIVRVFALWGVPEDRVRADFGAVRPHIHRVLVLAGELAHRHPRLFKRMLSLILGLIVPGMSPALAPILFDIFSLIFDNPPDFDFPGNSPPW